MGLASLRRFDVQANYACILSIASTLPCLAAVAFVVRNYRHELGQIVFGTKGLFVPIFFACILLSIVPSVLGFLLGWSSAGQRRNDKPTRSWIGFFVGGSVLTLDLILLIAFMMLHFRQPM